MDIQSSAKMIQHQEMFMDVPNTSTSKARVRFEEAPEEEGALGASLRLVALTCSSCRTQRTGPVPRAPISPVSQLPVAVVARLTKQIAQRFVKRSTISHCLFKYFETKKGISCWVSPSRSLLKHVDRLMTTLLFG